MKHLLVVLALTIGCTAQTAKVQQLQKQIAELQAQNAQLVAERDQYREVAGYFADQIAALRTQIAARQQAPSPVPAPQMVVVPVNVDVPHIPVGTESAHRLPQLSWPVNCQSFGNGNMVSTTCN